ncbi:hypothetical protein IE53DRAFT_384361 [Violaceomyces palustris]|uniref:Uncharacterized protein n=1 Tax=Violaceomyces palustris TaxID=1673888 RepID=A0ACD0P531_9BASI|nr:hypothetical protein IE53DRAFT_384361 [Violaceomyces palustris]
MSSFANPTNPSSPVYQSHQAQSQYHHHLMPVPFPSQGSSISTMTPPSPSSTSSSSLSSIHTLSFVPYYTPAQIEAMYAKQRASKMSESKWIANRNTATGFIQAVASRLGFPQRTTATAQLLYQRFHLFYPPTDFVLHEVALASLFLSSKLNDTAKKARDILMASYALRFPELVKGGGEAIAPRAQRNPMSSVGQPLLASAGSKRKGKSGDEDFPSKSHEALPPVPAGIGSVPESDVDQGALENERKRLLALERLFLECMCFNFQLRSQTALNLVVKFGRALKVPKRLCLRAWRIASDTHRTASPLQYPPNVIALASLYAAVLLSFPPTSGNVRAAPGEVVPHKVDVGDEDERAASAIIEIFSSSGMGNSADRGKCRTSDGICQVDLGSWEEDLDACIEDVEEVTHDILDLYLSSCSSLPAGIFATGSQNANAKLSAAAFMTPSPRSPAEPVSLEYLTPSPSSNLGVADGASSAGSSSKKTKVPPHAFSPPPFGVIDWIEEYQLKRRKKQASSAKGEEKPVKTAVSHASAAIGTKAGATVASPVNTSSSLRASSSNLSTVTKVPPPQAMTSSLTDIKIWLRNIEYEREKMDNEMIKSTTEVASLAESRPGGGNAAERRVQESVRNRSLRRQQVKLNRQALVLPNPQPPPPNAGSTLAGNESYEMAVATSTSTSPIDIHHNTNHPGGFENPSLPIFGAGIVPTPSVKAPGLGLSKGQGTGIGIDANVQAPPPPQAYNRDVTAIGNPPPPASSPSSPSNPPPKDSLSVATRFLF